MAKMAQIEEEKERDLVAVITKEIVGAAIDVSNELRPRLYEKIDERALALELRSRSHTYLLNDWISNN